MRPLRRHATPSLWGLGPVPVLVPALVLVLVLELEPVLMLVLMLPALQALVDLNRTEELIEVLAQDTWVTAECVRGARTRRPAGICLSGLFD